jgi:AcrR family transcriptional regulator
MPAPARTSTEAVVAAGRAILERDGIAGLTMQAVAADVGVRAPSLYKRVRDRAALVGMVVDAVAGELAARLDEAATTGDPQQDLRALAAAFRSFAHANPSAYPLLFDPRSGGLSQQALAESSAAVLRVSAALAGEDHALAAARTVVAWATGFLSMELAGAFQLGGDVDEAWEYGVRLLAASLRPRPEVSGSR